MAFSDTPNRLEAVFIQRDTTNSRYDQINISGSDLIVYLDSTGSINADKIGVWAGKYGIGSGSGGTGSSATSSWATNSIFAFTASFATRSLFSVSSSWASSSISSSYALTSSFAISASFSPGSVSASYSISSSYSGTASVLLGSVTSASYALSASYAISASNALSSSYALTASHAIRAITSSYSLSSSIAETASLANTISFVPQVALSASWASQSLSSSYSLTASYAISSSNTLSSSYSISSSYSTSSSNAISSSYALTSSNSVTASYATSASFALNVRATYIYANARTLILCAGFSPSSTGGDVAEIPLPYSNDGVTPISWSINRLNMRVQTTGSNSTSSVTFEKSISTGSFSGSSLGTLYLNTSSYETSTSSLGSLVSGNKIRFYINDLGDAQNWTLTSEIYNNTDINTGSLKKIIMLCAGFTPSGTGGDVVEIPIPYSTNGITSLAWGIDRLNFRVQLSGSSTSSVTFEKSTSTGAFSATSLGTISLNSGSYETFTGSLQALNSGDKMRFNVATLGDAQFWTLTAEISSLI